ncbi:membrane protein [Mycolicibacterium wolinskyi]|uniref:Membrane protein n=1 Tax=Mycolicibacterium wolinskyi TaxID=59750 RepID=A0A132PJI1_9MYCO|nr:EamA family transporter [Mycolicibacterium wolinskyi]KWX22172.1 membrane protein [Mycolicibacterium wolinskyi]
MSAPIMLAVLASALMHAVWNSLAHAIPDRLVGFALIGLVDAVGGAVLAAIGGLPPAGAWPFIIASALAHVVYNLLLLASYQLGEFSQMYPLARGTSPWLVAVIAMVFLGREMPVTELIGVLTISAGLIGLVFLGGRPNRKDVPALGAALLTGVTIAGYTVIDGVGVQHSPLFAYAGWMFLLQGPPLAILAAVRRGPRLAGAVRESAVPGLAGGAISLAAYTIVLAAQTSGALAPIAALRETSIVFGALIGSVFLGEKLGARRAIAAGVVLAGVLLISLP